MGVSKCNITSLVLNKIYNLRYGVISNDDVENEDLILDNYADFLNCITSSRLSCNPDSCNNPTIEVICSLSIDKLSIDDSNEDSSRIVLFYLDLGDIHNYKEPLEYQWSFDESVFTVLGRINSSSIFLLLKPGKSFDVIVTPVTLLVTDSNNCRYTITCYLTPDGLECGNYLGCPNPSNLRLINKFVRCTGISNLLVTKKV